MSSTSKLIRIWVKYRNNASVDFTLPASSNVSALLDLIIENSFIGFEGHRGPIDIYENEDGQSLSVGLKASLIRAITESTPLIVKIETSCKVSLSFVAVHDLADYYFMASLTYFSASLVLMVDGHCFLFAQYKDCK